MPIQKAVKKEMIQNLQNMFQPVAESKGFELYDVEFVKEGPNWYLRVFIDKEAGITIDDCETMSRAIEGILDREDPIPQAYILEVSSPGIDRALKKAEDFEKYKGRIVDIKLYRVSEKGKEFQGELLGKQNGFVSILQEDGLQLDFNEQDIAICRLAVIF